MPVISMRARTRSPSRLEMAAGRSRLFSAILIDRPSLDHRSSLCSRSLDFYKSSRARRNRENFIELISPIRRGANRSMTRKEEEGDRYRSEGERVFEKNFQTDHELTRLNNKRLINYSKRWKLLPSPPSIDRSIFRLFTPRSFSDSVEGSRIRFVSRSAR